jgi:endonuclease G, mitochondrial
MTKKTTAGDADQEDQLVNLLRRKAQDYLRMPNVTSVGIGRRIKDGKETDELTIQFTVERKLAPQALALENIPPLPTTITADDGTEIPVDVLERSYRASYRILDESELVQARAAEALPPARARRSRLDTLLPGISVSHVDGTAGTFGAVVYDALNGTPYILSNWHVLHGPTGAIGDNIVQPGPFDDGTIISNVMGRLVRSHLGVAGDCAVCSIIGRQLNDRILELDVVPKRIAKATLGDEVVKSGRTTGVTYGIVNRVGVVTKINYGGSIGTQQIGGFEIGVNQEKPPSNGEISMGGDSGSLWLIDTADVDKDVAVGLHFAGEMNPNPAAEHAVACAIHSVLQKLQVSFRNPLAEPEAASRRTARPSQRRR